MTETGYQGVGGFEIAKSDRHLLRKDLTLEKGVGHCRWVRVKSHLD